VCGTKWSEIACAPDQPVGQRSAAYPSIPKQCSEIRSLIHEMTAAGIMYPSSSEAKELIATLCKLFYTQVRVQSARTSRRAPTRTPRSMCACSCRAGCQELGEEFLSAVRMSRSLWHLAVSRRNECAQRTCSFWMRKVTRRKHLKLGLHHTSHPS
jgi:hypothetical protein